MIALIKLFLKSYQVIKHITSNEKYGIQIIVRGKNSPIEFSKINFI